MERVILSGPDFCAVTEDGCLVEYVPLDPRDQYGDLLLGRVDRMMPGLDCAFVDIGRKKSGFLPLKENSRSFDGPQLRSGQTVLVQVRREENGDKGAFLTRDVTLGGQRVVLMPCNRYIGCSSRLTDEAENNGC